MSVWFFHASKVSIASIPLDPIDVVVLMAMKLIQILETAKVSRDAFISHAVFSVCTAITYFVCTVIVAMKKS